MSRITIAAALAAIALATTAWAAEPETAKITHRFLAGGTGTPIVAIVGTDGKIEWSYTTGGACNDACLLPDGNVLFTYQTGAKEVTPDKKIVWQYDATAAQADAEVHGVQKLSDGNYLVSQNANPPRLLEIDPAGKIVKNLAIECKFERPHGQFRQIRKTKEGTYLGGFVSENLVHEYDAEGKILRTFEVTKHAYVAVRLPNGNTLIACGDGHELVEFDADGKEVWKLEENDLPGNPLRFVAGVQRLPNGNTVIANWLGHGGHTGKQPQLLEVTRDKKLVWSFWDTKQLGNLSTIQILDVEGDALR
ncbi:MAG TPA: hypothetical protein VE890_02140 [Thermoguttaceae bacterium]|nr:hypothetical protein [Thermoguttaceae bacterium]